MSKQILVVLVAAVVLLGLGVFGAIAFTANGDSGGPVMTMPDGSIMPADQMTTGGSHTMEDGSTMDDGDMTP